MGCIDGVWLWMQHEWRQTLFWDCFSKGKKRQCHEIYERRKKIDERKKKTIHPSPVARNTHTNEDTHTHTHTHTIQWLRYNSHYWKATQNVFEVTPKRSLSKHRRRRRNFKQERREIKSETVMFWFDPSVHQDDQRQVTWEVWVASSLLSRSNMHCEARSVCALWTRETSLKSILVCTGGGGGDVRTSGTCSLLLAPVKTATAAAPQYFLKGDERQAAAVLFWVDHMSPQVLCAHFCNRCKLICWNRKYKT